MSEQVNETREEVTVFVGDQIVGDAFLVVGDDDALPNDGDVLVSPKRWVAEAEHLAEQSGRVGVFVDPADVADDVLSGLVTAPLIVIDFPKFTDGRGYSVARTLRDRLGYAGDLRANGDVLIDQVPLMQRCGFTSFIVRHRPTLAALRAGQFKGLAHTYQTPASGERWQRRSRGAGQRAAQSGGAS